MKDRQEFKKQIIDLINEQAEYQHFTFFELADLFRDLSEEYEDNIEHKIEAE